MESKVFVVREPRCGGTLISAFIGSTYAKQHNVRMSIYNWCDTHDFDILETEVITHPNPIVLRIDRRNLSEHFLSRRAIRIVNDKFTNLTPEKSTNHLWERIKLSRVTITKQEVNQYIEEKILREAKFLSLMESYKIPNNRVWYEDVMVAKFDIPVLNMYNLDITPGLTNTTYKLPEYKRQVFTNYDDIPNWMKKFKDANIKKHNLEKLLEHWASYTSC